jgi:hypothetical protein
MKRDRARINRDLTPVAAEEEGAVDTVVAVAVAVVAANARIANTKISA